MHSFIGVSKITPPSLINILKRPRLTQLIKKGRDKQLTLILGQAVQGKSTLGTLYMNELSTPAAWVNLSREDSDPINLYYLLVRALEPVVAEEERSFLRSYPSVTMGPRLEIPLFRDAALALGRLGDPRARRILTHLTMTEEGRLKEKAVAALTRLNRRNELRLARGVADR